MRFKLNSEERCIHSILKAKYDKYTYRYFRSSFRERCKLESEIILLDRALRTLDFAALRYTFSKILGEESIMVDMKSNSNKKIILKVAYGHNTLYLT